MNSIFLGRYSLFIVSDIPETLRCLLCSKILENAHQAPCGCRFCFDCINNYLKLKERICPGEMEDCFEIKLITERDLRPDILAKRKISKLIVKCPLYFCDQECELRTMKDHIAECLSSAIICGKCNESIRREDYENHEREECKQGIVTCEFCDLLLVRKDLKESHFSFDDKHLCSQYRDVCPNECVEKDKVVWINHRTYCKTKQVECPYIIIGCTSKIMSSKDASKHLKDKDGDHKEMVLKHVINLSMENQQLKDNLANFTNELSEIKLQVADLEEEKKRMNHSIVMLNFSVKEIKKSYEDITEQREKELLEEKMYSEKAKQEMETIKKKLDLMDKTFQQMIEDKNKDLINETVIQHLNPTNKVLEWKVENFSMIHKLYSIPFYTHERGYKMQLMMFKITKGYLSFYARVLGGEFDEELSWPIRKQLKIRIFDQDNDQRHFDKTITFDEKTCKEIYYNFGKEIKVNDFISYEELYYKPYLLKNNNLLINCYVEDLNSKQ